MKKIPARKIAQVVALLILASAAVASRFPFGQLMHPSSYTTVVGLLAVLSYVPWVITVIGASLLFRRGRLGYVLVYLGFLSSFGGFAWPYIPFLRLPSFSPYAALATLLAVNGTLVGILVWCHLRERRLHNAERAA